MTPQTTVFDYAMDLAVTRGWAFAESRDVRVGLIAIDSHKRTVAVHPDSARVTLHINTVGGDLLWGTKR